MTKPPEAPPAHHTTASGTARVVINDLSILLVAIIWGSSYVVMQVVGRRVPAASFLALRFLTAVPVTFLLALRTLPRLTRSELVTGAVFGSLLYGILILETVGVQYTSAANAGFLITVSVVLVPVFERVISRRTQPVLVYVTTVTALIGCGFLLLSEGLHPRPGDVIILAAALVRATQITLFGRKTTGTSQSLVNLTLVEFVTVCVLASATSGVAGAPVWQVIGQVDIPTWLLIAYLGVLGSAYAFYAQLRVARAASSTRVGIILSTEPVFSTLFAVFAAAERLSAIQVLGGILIVLSATVGRTVEGREPGQWGGRRRWNARKRDGLRAQGALADDQAAPSSTTRPLLTSPQKVED